MLKNTRLNSDGKMRNFGKNGSIAYLVTIMAQNIIVARVPGSGAVEKRVKLPNVHVMLIYKMYGGIGQGSLACINLHTREYLPQ